MTEGALAANAAKDHIYIVGAGVAGIAAAYQIVQCCKQKGQSLPDITLFDQNPEIAQAASKAYGGFLTANSYLTVDFNSQKEAQGKLTTRYVPDAERTGQAGWSLADPTAGENRWINEVGTRAERLPEVKRRQELLYHRFGFSCINQWQSFFKNNPQLVEECSFRFSSGEFAGSGILKTYTPEADSSKFTTEQAFLKEVGGAAVHTRPVDRNEAHHYCPAVGKAYGGKAFYAVQHGGNVNGQVFCQKMLDYLKSKGCRINFLGEHEVTGIIYGGYSNDIQSLQIRNKDGQLSFGNLTDKFVFATGADANIWQKLGFGSSPVMSVAGTSLTVPVPDQLYESSLQTPLKFVDKYGGPVMIPINGEDGKHYIRMGGYVAFSGERSVSKHDRFAQDFLNRQLRMLETLYREIAVHFIEHELKGDRKNLYDYEGSWLGRRPVTPDNYAIIDHVPGKHGLPPSGNGFILAGHGAAGLLSMGTAEILAQMATGTARESVKVTGLQPSETKELLGMTCAERFARFREPLVT